MSEWLTTGEMIDRLKVGEVAHNVRGLKVTRFLNGNITWKNSGGIVSMSDSNLNTKWRILPKYVTFEEAMQALKDGKKIKVDNGIRVFDKNEDMEDSVGTYANWEDLLDGKWQIIE